MIIQLIMIPAFPTLLLHWLGMNSFDLTAPPFFKPLRRNDKPEAIYSGYANPVLIT